MSNLKSEKRNNKILVLCDYYLPGYKSGGGMRTIVNMVDRLKREYEFFIITRDHDGKLDRRSYKTVEVNQWNLVRDAKVFYLSKDNLKISKIRELILEVMPDAIYSNSYFATLTLYLLILKKLKTIPQVNIIVAPCGELSEGALKLNSTKKSVFIRLVKGLKLYKNIIWKASSELEKEEIKRVKESGDEIFIAPDMLPHRMFDDYKQELKPQKIKGEAKIIFLSRVMRKKNFKWILENLSVIRGKLQIDVYGPLEDARYWSECEEIIETFPKNIKVEAKGSVPHEEVLSVLLQYHFFIMPTLGENFGHIFLEALAAGCPLIISDQTPWLDLEKKGIGWDLSLQKPEEWNETLNFCIDLEQSGYTDLSNNARNFAVGILKEKTVEENTLKVIKRALEEVPTAAVNY